MSLSAEHELEMWPEWASIFDALADAVLGSDDSGSIRYANSAAARLLGWAAAELLGKPLVAIMPERLHAAHRAGFERFRRTRRATIIGRPIRVPALRRDGSEVDVELTLSALPGPGMRVLAVLRDLRERIELERKVAGQRKILAQYAAVGVLADATTASDAIPRILKATAEALRWDLCIYWALNPESDRLAASATWCSGQREAETFLAGSRGLTFGRGEALPGVVLETGDAVWSRDVTQDARYGRAALAAAHGFRSALLFPVYCSQRTWGVLEYVTRWEEDLDEELRQTMKALGFQIGQFLERVQKEEELQREVIRATAALGVRDEFLSVASHELRTPLTSLILQLSGLKRLAAAGRLGALPADRLEKRITLMDKQAARLSALVDELLDVSRLRTGRMELHREPTDLGNIVDEVATRLAAEANQAGISFRIAAADHVRGTWDRSRLDQVVTNIVGNAVKYAPRKPIEIDVGRTGDWAWLRVRDHGPGISEADQRRIFDQFERAAPRALAGLGLGLWIANRIVEAHGGHIEVASRPREGASFTVHLPLGAPDGQLRPGG